MVRVSVAGMVEIALRFFVTANLGFCQNGNVLSIDEDYCSPFISEVKRV